MNALEKPRDIEKRTLELKRIPGAIVVSARRNSKSKSV
jgi:hypothetical protein